MSPLVHLYICSFVHVNNCSFICWSLLRFICYLYFLLFFPNDQVLTALQFGTRVDIKVNGGREPRMLLPFCRECTYLFIIKQNLAQVGLSIETVSRVDLTCEDPLGMITSLCTCEHKVKFGLRCRKCGPCFEYRKVVWMAKLYNRWKHNGRNFRYVYLWTLGTNWSDTQFNRKLLQRCWYLFRKRVYTNQKRGIWKGWWSTLLYVLEAGEGGWLHLHVAVSGRLNQRLARGLWSDITGVHSPNVGYSPPRNRDPLKGMLYLSKYLSKDFLKWYWLGRMTRKVRELKYRFCQQEECGEYILMYEILLYNEDDNYTFSTHPW